MTPARRGIGSRWASPTTRPTPMLIVMNDAALVRKRENDNITNFAGGRLD